MERVGKDERLFGFSVTLDVFCVNSEWDWLHMV